MVFFGFLLIFALESAYTVLKEKRFSFPAKGALLLVPLFSMLAFSPRELSSSAISTMIPDMARSRTVNKEGPILLPRKSPREGAVDDQSPILAIDDADFLDGLDEVFGSDEKALVGRTVTMRGRFYHDEDQFHPNQGVVGRVVIMCCVPHGRFMGFCVQFDKAYEVDNETWIEASGTLEMIAIQKATIPVVRIEEWKKVKPGNIYLTP